MPRCTKTHGKLIDKGLMICHLIMEVLTPGQSIHRSVFSEVILPYVWLCEYSFHCYQPLFITLAFCYCQLPLLFCYPELHLVWQHRTAPSGDTTPPPNATCCSLFHLLLVTDFFKLAWIGSASGLESSRVLYKFLLIDWLKIGIVDKWVEPSTVLNYNFHRTFCISYLLFIQKILVIIYPVTVASYLQVWDASFQSFYNVHPYFISLLHFIVFIFVLSPCYTLHICFHFESSLCERGGGTWGNDANGTPNELRLIGLF